VDSLTCIKKGGDSRRLVSYQVAEETRASMTLILVHADSRQGQGDASDEAYQARNGALLRRRLVNRPRLR